MTGPADPADPLSPTEELVAGVLADAWPQTEPVDIGTRPAGFTCPVCQLASYNPTDVAEGYCGACHEWTGRPPAYDWTGQPGYDWTGGSVSQPPPEPA